MGLPLVTSSRDRPILGPAAAPLYQDQVTMLVGWFTFGNNLTDLGVKNPFLTVLDIEVKNMVRFQISLKGNIPEVDVKSSGLDFTNN